MFGDVCVDCSQIDNQLLKRWKEVVAKTDDIYFSKRLEWSGISEEKMRFLLSAVERVPEDHKFPEWCLLLDNFMLKPLKPPKLKRHQYVDTNNPLPFQDLVIPIVEFAFTNISFDKECINQSGIDSLKKGLLEELTILSSQSLLEHFVIANISYRAFVSGVMADNYKEFFVNYPALARLLFTRINFWIRNAELFFKRFKKDRTQVANMLGVKKGAVVVSTINTNLSESHNCGKNVFLVFISSGKTPDALVREKGETSGFSPKSFIEHKCVVYKQKNMRSDYNVYDFVRQLNKRGLFISHYIPRIVVGDEYGWMEYIEHKQCTTVSEVKKYFERMGSLLAIMYLLGGTDCNSENVICCGSYPILIDLETTFSPDMLLSEPHLNKLNEYIDKVYGDSVSRVGMLPQWVLDASTDVSDNSALWGMTGKQRGDYPRMVWHNINRKSMYFKYMPDELKLNKNVVYLKGKSQQYANYADCVLTGFERTYKLLLRNKKWLLSAKITRLFDNLKIRFVFRATRIYTILLDYLNHPDFMRSGTSRSVEMDILSKGLLTNLDNKHLFWNILDSEYTSLDNGDIPYYWTYTNDTDMYDTNGKLFDKAFSTTGYKAFLSRIKHLSTEDLNFQKKITRGSLQTIAVEQSVKIPRLIKKDVPVVVRKQDLLTISADIARKIIDSRIDASDERCTWMSYVSNVVSQAFGYKPIGLDLANGNVGVAVFLSALYSVENKPLYRKYALKTLNPVVDILKEGWSKKEFVSRFGLGGTTGLGSLIYGIAKIYEYTEEARLLCVIDTFIDLVDPHSIDKSVRADVVSGTAGCLLSLIFVYELMGNRRYLDKAKVLVERILASAVTDGNKFRGWKYQADKYLLGFSHGSSGILYALSRFLKHVDDKRAVDTIRRTLEFEEKEFVKDANNWPDYRFEEVNPNAVSWCHGATGVGLSRLELLNNAIFRIQATKDTDRAYKKTLESGVHELDTLCCGNSGRVDFLLELGLVGYTNKGFKKAEELASVMIHEYKKTGNFNCFPDFITKDNNVGFYQGLAGIGYELLRIYDPIRFRSVLLFK